jgi:hypothetical protein
VKKSLLGPGLFSAEDLLPAHTSSALARQPTTVSDPQLLADLREKMAEGRGRGGGRGAGRIPPNNGQPGQNSGNWNQPVIFPPPQQNPSFPQQLGYGFGYSPPPWGFPNQFQGPYPPNQWVNPQSWQQPSSQSQQSQQQFPALNQVSGAPPPAVPVIVQPRVQGSQQLQMPGLQQQVTV